MLESGTFSDFEIREASGRRPVAVLHPAWPGWDDGSAPLVGEGVFDLESLAMRVHNLRRAGLDASVSEAALRALEDAVATPPVAPSGPPGAAVLPAASAAGAALGLPGRGVLLRAIADAVRAAETVGSGPAHFPLLAVIRLPGLTGVGEQRGREAEIAVLLGAADRLGENLRLVDTLAHLGGATFAACLPRVPRADATAIARRLRLVLSGAPVEAPGGPVHLSAVVGVLEASRDRAASPEERAAALLGAADRHFAETESGSLVS